MNDKDREVLLKIHKHVKKTISYCENIDTQEAFESNSQCVEACVFNLSQIGEPVQIFLGLNVWSAEQNYS